MPYFKLKMIKVVKGRRWRYQSITKQRKNGQAFSNSSLNQTVTLLLLIPNTKFRLTNFKAWLEIGLEINRKERGTTHTTKNAQQLML